MNIESIAKVAYEAQRAFHQTCAAYSQREWDVLSDEAKRPVIERVRFTLEYRGAPVTAWHDRWMLERLQAGWKLGPVADPVAKTDPRLKPWSTLSVDEKRADLLFVRVVEALAAGL